MSEKDDNQAWLEALAGRGVDATPAAREAAALREAIAHHSTTVQAAEGEVPEQDAMREVELIARARREGLIGESGERRGSWVGVGRWPLGRWLVGRSGGWAIAAVACLAIGIGLYVSLPPAPEVVRSSPDGVARLQADDPVQVKRELIADLRAAGVQPTGYEFLGRQGVDADLPLPLSDAVRRVLAKYGIAEPADGVLRVEIAQRESP